MVGTSERFQASDTAFRQLVNRGYLKYIPNGQVLVFSIALAGFFYLLKIKQLSPRPTGLLRLRYSFFFLSWHCFVIFVGYKMVFSIQILVLEEIVETVVV